MEARSGSGRRANGCQRVKRRARMQRLFEQPGGSVIRAILLSIGIVFSGAGAARAGRRLRNAAACIAILAALLCAPIARAADPLASWNDGAAKQVDRRVRRERDARRRPGVHRAGRAHRGLRQRRHALGRAADLLPARVRVRPGPRARGTESALEDHGALREHPRQRHQERTRAAARRQSPKCSWRRTPA